MSLSLMVFWNRMQIPDGVASDGVKIVIHRGDKILKEEEWKGLLGLQVVYSVYACLNHTYNFFLNIINDCGS